MAKNKTSPKPMTTAQLRKEVRNVYKAKSPDEIDRCLELIRTWTPPNPAKDKDCVYPGSPGYTVKGGLYRDVMALAAMHKVPMSDAAKVFLMDVMMSKKSDVLSIPRRLFFPPRR